MKKFMKTMSGVTLLEVMLVLAIAAMIIVMSVRYYQSASVSQQANMAIQQVQAITSGADNLAIGNSSYSSVNNANLSAIIGRNNLVSPTGASVEVTSIDSTSYSVSMPLGNAICTSVKPKLVASPKIDNPTCTGGVLSYTYKSNN